ncbi:M48 family metallopeptidase [Glacieibacterium sp.]|uniref:M48 family metallopeptidase n=1 Tax=Glacieibacterium sp. TaxID=2860237 RepID=UPI003B00C855
MALLAAAFDVDAATRAYLATLSGAARAKSDSYFEGGYWLILWNAVVGIGITLALLRLGWIGRLSAWSQRLTRGRMFLATLVFALAFLLLTTLIGLPWTLYTGFFREHQYGMSTQSLAAFAGDTLKGMAIGVPLTALIIAGVMAAVRRSPRFWWSYAAVLTIAFLAFGIAVAPVLIEPLFNKYTPMAESPLRTAILKMAQANGVPATNVYVVDASRQTTRVSANVAGLGSTTRVALNDNLLNTHDDAGVLAVMGHETGHYVLHHIASLIVSLAIVVLLGFITIQVVVPGLIARNPGWGIPGITDPGAIAVATMVLTLFFFLATPVTNTITRFHEAQADIFGLNAARAPDGFARSAIRLGQYRKLEPTPFEEAVFFDHPSGYTRIHQAMQWKAEHLGEPGVQ